MTQWKGKHEEQRRDIADGYRYIWPPAVTERWAREFELALEQRGEEARRIFEFAKEACYENSL